MKLPVTVVIVLILETSKQMILMEFTIIWEMCRNCKSSSTNLDTSADAYWDQDPLIVFKCITKIRLFLLIKMCLKNPKNAMFNGI